MWTGAAETFLQIQGIAEKKESAVGGKAQSEMKEETREGLEGGEDENIGRQ